MFQICAIFPGYKEWWKTWTGVWKCYSWSLQLFWVRCLGLFRAYCYIYTQFRKLETGIDERQCIGTHSTLPADGHGMIQALGICLRMPGLISLCLCEPDMGFYERKCERFGGLPFAQKMASSGNIPFSTFSGLLESFQVEDSHLLNHEKTLALLWMSFIQVCWPGLTLFRLGSNEPTTQGAVVALSRLCK